MYLSVSSVKPALFMAGLASLDKKKPENMLNRKRPQRPDVLGRGQPALDITHNAIQAFSIGLPST